MEFTSKKTENCFADRQTWEYLLPIDGETFAASLGDEWSVRRNTRLRRPVFVAERSAITIKGTLREKVIRVSYPDAEWQSQKDEFEQWLANVEAS